MSRRFALLLAAGLAMAAGYSTPGFAADQGGTVAPAATGINGPWNYETEGRNGRKAVTNLVLKQDGEKLTGTLQGMRGEPVEIQDGSFKNNEFSFKVVRSWNGNEMVTRFSGKLEGDVLKGTTAMERNGKTTAGEFQAKRGAAAPRPEAPAVPAPAPQQR